MVSIKESFHILLKGRRFIFLDDEIEGIVNESFSILGYITPFVIQTLLGKEGCFVLLTLITMTLMSTGSGEVMSVSSVLVYDIIKTHITPFR